MRAGAAESEARAPTSRAERRRARARVPGAPPLWLQAAVLLGGAVLLFYPLHVPYQNPDQDLPVTASLVDYARGGWSPVSLHYPSGLSNLLRLVYAAAQPVAGASGAAAERVDLFAVWGLHHRWFRVPPRAIAMASGVAMLLFVHALVVLVADRWSALAAVALLATAAGFVRESHHGMYDAPMAAAVAGALWALTRYVRYGARPAAAAGGALLGVAFAFKQNSAIAVVALAAALLASSAPWRRRAGDAVFAVAGGLAALLALSPATLLEPVRFAAYLRILVAVLYAGTPQALEASPPPYGLAAVLWNGTGPALLALAAAGAARAIARRERALVPLAAWTVVYGGIAAGSYLVLNRYALPLLPGLAALAAYGLAGIPPLAPRLVVAVVVAALQLLPTVAYLRLLAAEDTRVAAADWLRANVAEESVVFLPGGPLWSAYVAPDLALELRLPREVDAELARTIRARVPSRPLRWARNVGRDPDAPLAPYAGAIVVTAEHPSPRFARVVTSPRLMQALEAGADLLADFPIAAGGADVAPGAGDAAAATTDRIVYEPGDLNFAPVAGAGSLLHPGPRLRIWRVPPTAR